MLKGEAISTEEKKCKAWVTSPYFTGGLDTNEPTASSKFLDSLISEAAHPFYVWMKNELRRMASPSSAVHLEMAGLVSSFFP